MEAELFWQLLADICQLGEFIIGIETDGIEINIVGKFQVTYDGLEMVLEKQACGDHFHIAPEKIQAFRFGYCYVSTGGKDPCIDLLNVNNQASLRLFYYPYQQGELTQKCEQFIEQHQKYKAFLTGAW